MAKSSKPKNKVKNNKKNLSSNRPNNSVENTENTVERAPELIATLQKEIEKIAPQIEEKAEILAQKLPKFRSDLVQFQLIQFINFFLYKDAVAIIYKPLIKAYAEANNLPYDPNDEENFRGWFENNFQKVFNLDDESQMNEIFWILAVASVGQIFSDSTNLIEKLEQFYKVTNFDECLEVFITAVPYYLEFLDSMIDAVSKEVDSRYFSEFSLSVLDHMLTVVKTKEQSKVDFEDVNRYVKLQQSHHRATTLVQLVRYIFDNI